MFPFFVFLFSSCSPLTLDAWRKGSAQRRYVFKLTHPCVLVHLLSTDHISRAYRGNCKMPSSKSHTRLLCACVWDLITINCCSTAATRLDRDGNARRGAGAASPPSSTSSPPSSEAEAPPRPGAGATESGEGLDVDSDEGGDDLNVTINLDDAAGDDGDDTSSNPTSRSGGGGGGVGGGGGGRDVSPAVFGVELTDEEAEVALVAIQRDAEQQIRVIKREMQTVDDEIRGKESELAWIRASVDGMYCCTVLYGSMRLHRHTCPG